MWAEGCCWSVDSRAHWQSGNDNDNFLKSTINLLASLRAGDKNPATSLLPEEEGSRDTDSDVRENIAAVQRLREELDESDFACVWTFFWEKMKFLT